MSQQKAFDNIMNYFNDEEEEEEEEEEESNYILNFNNNKKKEDKRKKRSSLRQENLSLTINNIEKENENKDKVSNNKDNNKENNYISYFDSNSSGPETPKLNSNNNNKEEEKLIENKNEEDNKNKNGEDNIFSETLNTKFKDINSNSISLMENYNENENLEYYENPNIRQTFCKNKNLNNDKINNESEESQKDLSVNKDDKIEKMNELEEDKKEEKDKNNLLENSKINKMLDYEENNEKSDIMIKNNKYNINNNHVINNYNNEIKKKKLLLELQKNREKLRQIENININENENILLTHNKKDTNSMNNSNNIKFINFKEIKELDKDYNIEKENNNIKSLNKEDEENNVINKRNELISNINADNLDKLVSPILYNNNNKISNKESKVNKKEKNINAKKQMVKSKSSDLFNIKNKRKNKSDKINSTYNEKLISKIINNNSKNKKISILGIVKSFFDLKIINLLILKNSIEIDELKEIAENIDEKEDSQKKKELEFIEQIWFLLNQNDKEFINEEIFENFIKLLYPYSINLKQSTILYLKEFVKIVNFMDPKNYIKNIDEYYYSPLRQKSFSKNEIWSIEKIVQTFFELKMNSIAYKRNYINIDRENNNINKDKKKEKRKNYNFDKLYESFMLKKKIREKTLKIMREEQEKENSENLSKYTYIPKINKKKEKISDLNETSVYEKLYKRRNDRNRIIEKLKYKYNKDNNKKEENFSFKPKILEYENIKQKFKKNCIPKNCNRYINKNLELIQRKKEEKIKEEKKYNGSNYENVRKIKFNCEGSLYKPKKIKKEKKEEKGMSVQIKLPYGKMVKLNIDLNEDIEKKVDEFCKIYSLNGNIKRKIINQIETYKKIYEEDIHSESDDY